LIVVNSYPASQLALHAATQMGLKSVVIFYDADNFAYTGTYVDGFSEQFQKAGGNIETVYEFSSSDEPDFRPMLEEAKSYNPDGLMIIASAVDTALIAQQANLVGFDAQLLTSNWAFTDDLLQNGGRAVEGILAVISNDVNNNSPEYLDFVSQFQERFKREPTFAAGYGYEAITVLAAALEKTGGSPDALGETLLEIRKFTGVHGDIQFDKYGDVERTLYMIAVQNGKFETRQTIGIPSQ
jgi:branched-chain amino acid transport system substrate-binding protein